MSNEHDPLRDLFHETVADVEPADRLGQIRRRTAQRRRTAPRWPLVVGAAGTATAAVVGVVALVGSLHVDPRTDEAAEPAPREAAVATYFTGPSGVYREFQTVPATDDSEALVLSALQLLEEDSGPLDPDYSTVWPDGSFTGVTIDDAAIRVHVGAPARVWPEGATDGNLVDSRPWLQQVVHTAQAALGRLWPVVFETGEQPVTVLGVPAGDELARDSSVAAPVNITDPTEGHTVDDLLTLRGIVGGWGADLTEVTWELRAADDRIAASGTIPVDARAWEHTEDIEDVASGTYLLVVSDADLEDGPFPDTRTVTVR